MGWRLAGWVGCSGAAARSHPLGRVAGEAGWEAEAAVDGTVASAAGPPGAVLWGAGVARLGAAALTGGLVASLAAMVDVVEAGVGWAAVALWEAARWAERPGSRTESRVAEMVAAGWAGAEVLVAVARAMVRRAAWWVVRVGSADSAAG